MKLIKIINIEKKGKEEVFDIHHRISSKYFYDEHPNLIANSLCISNCSRHAGGIAITHNAPDIMPLIKSGGILQTPWPEGLNARHLEDFGILKFDILGLGTLRMFEECIRKILIKEGNSPVTFQMIKDWYYKNLHPDNNNMDDIEVYKNIYWEGKFAGVFQFVNPSAQKFIQDLKPTCIEDIAVATSIYRPGPLAISADKLYLNNRRNPEKVMYRHPLIKEALESTCGMIVFQEQLQILYHTMAGYDMEDTDGVRKAFTKKDLSNKEKAAKQREEMRVDFITKCQDVNGIHPDISGEVFDNIEKFIAYSFNKSHAVAYASVSYQCAYLLHHYPDEWITTYIDYCATEKGTQSGKESPKSIALREAKMLGYTLGKADINFSEKNYTNKGKTLIPSFASLKYVGSSVLEEIEQYRPYVDLEDLMFNRDNTWRHSKLNRRALSTLIKLEALGSMKLVGEGRTFNNYRQLHYVVVEKGDDLKKACNKKNKTNVQDLQRYIEEAKQLPDWTLAEKIQFSKELSGSVDLGLIVTPEIADYFESQNIVSVDDLEHENQIVWGICKSSTVATTKNGKTYLNLKLYGESGVEYKVFCWNFNPKKDKPIPEDVLILGTFESGNFGLSTRFGALEVLLDKKNI